MKKRKFPPQQQEEQVPGHVIPTESNLLVFPKLDLVQRLRNAYDCIDTIYHERDILLMVLALMANELHLWAGIARNPEPTPDWHQCLVLDLPSGQVCWAIPDEHLPLFKDIPAYPWRVELLQLAERNERLLESGFHLTRTNRTEKVIALGD